MLNLPRSRRRRARSGLSLLEVLIAMAVLLFGLLAAAALIIVGGLTLIAVERADRTGVCGRAARHDVKARNMLDYRLWWRPDPNVGQVSSSITLTAPIAIDPLGYLAYNCAAPGAASYLDSVNSRIERMTLQTSPGAGTALSSAQADPIFHSRDDLISLLPENDKSANPAPAGTRPIGLFVQADGTVNRTPTATPASVGRCSWFLTLSPAPAERSVSVANRTAYNVSAVVCYGRNLRTTGGVPDGEHVTTNDVALAGGYGGGTVTLASADVGILNFIKKNQWIMLVLTHPVSGVVTANWYRVVSVGDASTGNLELVGPDWESLVAYTPATLVVVDDVTGVYSGAIPVEK